MGTWENFFQNITANVILRLLTVLVSNFLYFSKFCFSPVKPHLQLLAPSSLETIIKWNQIGNQIFFLNNTAAQELESREALKVLFSFHYNNYKCYELLDDINIYYSCEWSHSNPLGFHTQITLDDLSDRVYLYFNKTVTI